MNKTKDERKLVQNAFHEQYQVDKEEL